MIPRTARFGVLAALIALAAVWAATESDDSELAMRGGTGGRLHEIRCDGPVRALGLSTQGAFVSSIAVLCAAAGDDDDVEGRAGTEVGREAIVRCAADELVVGIYGATGSLVDRIGLVCRHDGADHFGNAVGGSGGAGFVSLCPGSGPLRGLRVRAGTVIDAVSVICE